MHYHPGLDLIDLLSTIVCKTGRASITSQSLKQVWRQALSHYIHSLIMICLDITGQQEAAQPTIHQAAAAAQSDEEGSGKQ